MDIRVGVGAQQILVRLQRVVNLDLRRVAVGGETIAAVPSAVVIATTKSSMRSSVPSTFSPDGSVTVTVVGFSATGGGPPRPPPLPGNSHVCCSSRGSSILRRDAAQIAGRRMTRRALAR